MTICEECKKANRDNPPCLKTGKPCRKVENLLERENARQGYSMRHIRRKEVPYENNNMDFLVNAWGDRVYGRKKPQKFPEY